MNANGMSIVMSIRRLSSPDPKERESARAALVEVGSPATSYLIQALDTPDGTARQEAFRALRDIADPDAAGAFVQGLDDDDSACRWLAAEGLAALGRVGLTRTLDLLEKYPPNEHILRGAHHVLSSLEKTGFAENVRPVLQAFTSKEPQIDLPTAAMRERSRLGDRPSASMGS